MAKITLEIISQEKPILSAEVDQITAPSAAGEVTILPNHIPLFTKLNDGVLLLKIDNRIEEFGVMGGFMDVGPDSQVTILADAAVRAGDVDIAKAEEAKRRAEEAMKNKESEVDLKEAEASLRRALFELRTASRRRQRPQLPDQE